MVNIESVRSWADRIFNTLVFVMAVAFFISSFALPASSALLPRGVAFITAVLDFPVMIGIWRKPAASSEEKVTVPIYTSALLLIVYYVALVVFGYVVATFVYIIAVGRMIGLRNRLALVALSVIMTVSTYYLFGVFFVVSLPNGLLFQSLF